ncbi:hypothetical protein ACEUZ9_004238 [Paracoccus litorisediminis]|uniref:calcium-binding protein n=1 Tax=Paracoccus litorisediminis TaxID=2006130 RepID=UPI001478F6E7
MHRHAEWRIAQRQALFGDLRATASQWRSGQPLLLGGQGSDSRFGDTGNDVIDGGQGDDRLWGNRGTDTPLDRQETIC